MRRKRWSYLIACVVLAGGLAAPGTYTKVYAQDYENVEYVTSVSELRDSMDEADVVNSADVMDRGADVDAAAMYSSESADIYSLRRIILYTDEVPETYGATTVICYDKYDYYVLGYDTEEATKSFRKSTSLTNVCLIRSYIQKMCWRIQIWIQIRMLHSGTLMPCLLHRRHIRL